jgi:hypothetical protein
MHAMVLRLRRFVVLLLVLIALAPAAGAATQDASPVASPVVTAPLIDLAAMTLTTDDLAERGFADFVIADGRTQSLEDRVAFQAAGGDDPDSVRTGLTTIGWTRAYRNRLAHPAAPGGDAFDALIVSGVTQYAGDDGAATGWGLVSTLDFVAGEATPVARPRTIGDQSQLVELAEGTFDDGSTHPGLRLIFRHGALVGDVIVFGATGETLAAGDIEALGERLIERMDRVLGGDAPDLSYKTLRWQGLGVSDPDLDNYLKLDGQMYLGLGDTEEDASTAAETYKDATDYYRYEAALTETLFQFTSIAAFPTGDLAAAWVQEAHARTEQNLPTGATLETVADVPSYGDASLVLKVTTPVEGGAATGVAVFVQFGDQTMSLALISLGDLDVANVVPMAAAQVACFEAGDCAESVPLPAWIAA